MAQALAASVGAFQAEFTGAVITPDDPDYDRARSVFNGAINRRPVLIARCTTPQEVAAAIKFSKDQGLEVSVRGGGHNFAGFAVCDGGVMIDLSEMRQITVDAAARRAMAGGGATWADVDAATQAHGLAVPGGFISRTGIAGLTLGGGIGHLTALAGLSLDNLVSAQVVTADGRILTASANDNPDLFWAIRGGGGNFGVVTRFEYRLQQVGPLVNVGLFFWGLDRGTDGLRYSREFLNTLTRNASGFVAGLSAPPAPFVPQQYHHAVGFALLVVGFQSAEEHADMVRPIRETVPPLFELVTPMPYTRLQQMFDEGNPWGVAAYEKSLYLDDLTDEAIRIFTEFLPKKSSPLSIVPVFHLGGAYGRVSDDETAFGGSRKARYAFNITAVCPDPALYDGERSWVRSFWQALRSCAASSGSYVNFMSEFEEDRVKASYGTAKYERLARIKAKYDPHNVFHLNVNIKPALHD
jgi:FAD/FMN-containing dehydrogenase